MEWKWRDSGRPVRVLAEKGRERERESSWLDDSNFAGLHFSGRLQKISLFSMPRLSLQFSFQSATREATSKSTTTTTTACRRYWKKMWRGSVLVMLIDLHSSRAHGWYDEYSKSALTSRIWPSITPPAKCYLQWTYVCAVILILTKNTLNNFFVFITVMR